MLYIIYQRDKHRVRLIGHADGGEPGRDLICAAASVLAHTLASLVYELDGEDADIRLRSGDALIACKGDGRTEQITAVFDTVCRGFSLLGEQFPECVSFRQAQG